MNQKFELANFDIPGELSNLETDLDHFWTALTGAVVLIMQLGFAFLEGGCVRFNNMQSIMIKVMTNTAICMLLTWIVGYGLMFGQTNNTNFNGTSQFGGLGFQQHPASYADFVFNSALACAANSIVSGGAAERMSITGYAILSVLFSGWIYPVVIHWCYGDGWLKELDYHDFAGSGAIHLTAGIGALVVTIMLKPRTNRFESAHADRFKPSNPTYICLATLTLYMAWMCFNSGSTLALSNDQVFTVARSITNTMIAGASGGLTVFIYHYIANHNSNERYSLVMLCNGNLAGLVAVTGSNDEIENWAAFTIGVMGGIMYVISAYILHKLHVDDPVDAVPIHAGCGLLGAMCPGWFSTTRGIYYGYGPKQWGVQALGCICFIAWSAAWHILATYILKHFHLLRVDDFYEQQGLDKQFVGGPAFFYEEPRDAEMKEPDVKNIAYTQVSSKQ